MLSRPFLVLRWLAGRLRPTLGSKQHCRDQTRAGGNEQEELTREQSAQRSVQIECRRPNSSASRELRERPVPVHPSQMASGGSAIRLRKEAGSSLEDRCSRKCKELSYLSAEPAVGRQAP